MVASMRRSCVLVTEAGSYLRLIDFCITQLKAQGPSRTCNESKEEKKSMRRRGLWVSQQRGRLLSSSLLLSSIERSDTKVYEP